MLTNAHREVYNSLEPAKHDLADFPPPHDFGLNKPTVDEKLAELVYYGQLKDDTDMQVPENPFLFAIKLGRKLQKLGL